MNFRLIDTRPSAHELLKHPFMRAAKRTDVLPKLLESRRAAKVSRSSSRREATGFVLLPTSISDRSSVVGMNVFWKANN